MATKNVVRRNKFADVPGEHYSHHKRGLWYATGRSPAIGMEPTFDGYLVLKSEDEFVSPRDRSSNAQDIRPTGMVSELERRARGLCGLDEETYNCLLVQNLMAIESQVADARGEVRLQGEKTEFVTNQVLPTLEYGGMAQMATGLRQCQGAIEVLGEDIGACKREIVSQGQTLCQE